MRLFLSRNRHVLYHNLTHSLFQIVEVEDQVVFLVQFGLVWLLVGDDFHVEGILGQRFLLQDGV